MRRLSLAATVLLLSLAACKPGAETEKPSGPLLGPDLITAERTACEKSGGRLVSGGKAARGALICLHTTQDGGKHCTRAGQCEGDCLARGNVCAPVRPLFGCNDILGADGSRATLCRD